jgi:hypothetical protein
MFNRFAVLRGLVVLTSVSIFSPVTWANGFEVEGFGGGMTMDSGIGTHPIYGAAASFRLGDSLHLFGEFSHATILSETVSGVNANGKVSNYGGGADVSFRSPEAKVRPYMTAGLGVGHFYATGSGSANGASVNVSATVDNALYEEIGAGVRVRLAKHLGLKPEVRYIHYNSSTSGLLGGAGVASSNGVQYTVGVFFGK